MLSQQNSKVKLKDIKKDEYLNLARELNKLLNEKVTVIPIVTGALGAIPQRIDKKPGKHRN